jgi:glutaredoxin
MTVITLLTRPDCTTCEQAKTVLARVGEDHQLLVEEIALDSEQGESIATRLGVMFAPGILIDGELFGFGQLSERALRRALDRRITAQERK